MNVLPFTSIVYAVSVMSEWDLRRCRHVTAHAGNMNETAVEVQALLLTLPVIIEVQCEYSLLLCIHDRYSHPVILAPVYCLK